MSKSNSYPKQVALQASFVVAVVVAAAAVAVAVVEFVADVVAVDGLASPCDVLDLCPV